MKLRRNLVYYLLCAYIVLRPIFPSGIAINCLPKIHKIPAFGDIILFLLIILLAADIITNRAEFIGNIKNFFRDFLGISLTIFLGIMCASIIYASYKVIAVTETLRFLSFVLLYFIVKYNVDRREVKGLITSYIIAFSILNIYGIFQKITGFGLIQGYSMITSNAQRTNATFDNPNTFAAFLILGAFPVVMMIVHSKKMYQKSFYSILFIVTLCNIYFTGSRNSFIALVIGGVAISILYNWYFLIGIAVTAAAAFSIAPVRARVLAIGDPSLNESRIKLWQTALKMIQNHPILGVGNGNYIELYDTYVKDYKYLAYLNYSHYPSHNSFLKVEAELGIVGGLSFLSIIVNSILKIKNVIDKIDDKTIKLFYVGFLASVIGFIFMNFIDNLFFLPEVVAYFWIFLAASDGLLLKEKYLTENTILKD